MDGDAGRLGWLAIRAGLIDAARLSAILAEQQAESLRIGQLMLRRGVLDEAALIGLLALQEAWTRMANSTQLTPHECEAVAARLVERGEFTIEGITKQSERKIARPRSTRRLGLGPCTGQLGWVAVTAGLISTLELAETLARQRKEGHRPLGELLIERQLLDVAQLEELLALQAAWTDLCQTHGLLPPCNELLARELAATSCFDVDSLRAAESHEGVRAAFAAAGITLRSKC